MRLKLRTSLMTIERLQRSPEMSMKDFVIDFERFLSKARSRGTNYMYILAHRLLKPADVSEQHARATMGELKYKIMKAQSINFFGNQESCVASED